MARGGLLAAVAVALLYGGSVWPWMGAAACVIAGVSTAVPLMRHGGLRAAVLLYAASTALAALVVPRKSIVLGYAVFGGLYPILKYAVEARVPRRMQRWCKLAYWNVLLAAALLLVRQGLLPWLMPRGWTRLALLCVAANIIFWFYDIGLSRLIARLIARLQSTLPPD